MNWWQWVVSVAAWGALLRYSVDAGGLAIVASCVIYFVWLHKEMK